MKSLFASLLAAATATAANWDSVAVFHRPEKVLVQIDERGQTGRLKDLMNILGADQDMLLITQDQSFKIDCGRNDSAATCILRFLPPKGEQFPEKKVEAQLALSELGLTDKPVQNLEIAFLNSNGDNLQLKIESGLLSIRAAKK